MVAGTEVLIAGLVVWTIVTILDVGILQKTDPQYRRSFAVNMVLTQFAVLPYIIAGITMLAIGAGGLYFLVPAVLFSFIKAILDAWVLLIEINR